MASGAVLTVVAFIAWNLLAQRLPALKSAGGLDFHGTLPAVAGTVLFGPPVAHLWVLLPAALTSAITFGCLGALSGLAPARPETATLAGQFGLTAVMFVGLIPPQSLPDWSSPIRAALPIAYDIDAFASALTPHPGWTAIALRLTCSAVFGSCRIGLAARSYRDAMDR
ncbi:hypothetical protein [Actinomadura madurae]|uniref:hypothetical protein n=1 Tax=Actinomadura madurae TaxID=1993 RepID=UPI0020D22F71|nr:hypothetical protein [Actinomadura madurae]MCP9955408.1 hypothetical protein [Actinomadura madurae]MCP9972142.1 hypothetical protein [Actinomadura madurae]MCP9984645.1 hypothetical protein [Actinomadura madurae]MCQ0003803.1 hypothetical protein [Actinomadura madurae]MCQ0020838.1 hypothetical protein [Actinomadura madurae]